MQQRLQYRTLSPALYAALGGVSQALTKSALGMQLINLVYQRVSQINGCAYCVDLHYRDLRKTGESEQRLNSLVTWREAPFYSERERAALDWVEAVTLIGETRAPQELFDALRPHFSDTEIADLTFAIATMNAWNRMAISMRQPVPPAA